MVDGRVPEPRPARVGRVVDAGGAPKPHALIVIVASSVPMPEIALQCDASGRFPIRLPAGHFTLRAHAGDEIGEAEVDGDDDGEFAIVVGPAR